jgi:hypothetical protein
MNNILAILSITHHLVASFFIKLFLSGRYKVFGLFLTFLFAKNMNVISAYKIETIKKTFKNACAIVTKKIREIARLKSIFKRAFLYLMVIVLNLPIAANAANTEYFDNNFYEDENDYSYEFNISKDNLNRIKFNHKLLKLNTISDAQIKVDNGSIYILPQNDKSITLFVTPEDEENLTYLVILNATDIKAQDINIPIPKSFIEKEKLENNRRRFERLRSSDNTSGENGNNKFSNDSVHDSYSNNNYVFERKIINLVKEYWHNLQTNKSDLLAGGELILSHELDEVFGDDIYSKNFCGSALSEDILSVTTIDEYAFVLLDVINPLNISTHVICESEISTWSVLNTTLVEPFGMKKLLVVLPKKDLIYVQ